MPSYTFGEILRTYKVSFGENGIEDGSSWFVNLTGNVSPSSGPLYGANCSFYLPNGSYTYSIGSTSYFNNVNEERIFVNRTAVNISVSFQKYANIKGMITPWSFFTIIGGEQNILFRMDL